MAALLAAAAWACADYMLAPTQSVRQVRAIKLSAAQLSLNDGDSTTVVATLLDQSGKAFDAMPAGTQIAWSSTADTIVAVSGAGVIGARHPGGATVTASLGVAGGSVAVSVPVTVLPVPRTLALAAGDSQAAPVGQRFAQDLRVRVTDRWALGVPGVEVDFAVASGHGTLTAASATTDSTGRAGVGLTPDTVVGSIAVEARTARLPQALVRFSATARAGVPATIAKAGGDAQSAAVGTALPLPLVVSVADRYGNATPGIPVDFTVAAGHPALTAASVTTDSAGRAGVGVMLDTVAGPAAVDARTAQIAAASAHFTATAQPGPASRLLAVSGDSQAGTSGAQLPATLVVRALDRFGNPVPGLAVTWQTASGGGTLTPASAATDSLGRASAQWTLGYPEGTQSALALVGSTLVAGFSATGRGVVASVAVSPATPTLAAGQTQVLAATPKDARGNTLAGRTVTWTSSDTNVAAVDSTGLVRTGRVGTATITATSAGVAGTTSVTVTPGAAAQLLRVSGDSQGGASGAALAAPLVAGVLDRYGNPVAGATVTWEVVAGGGSITPASDATDALGHAVARWTLGYAEGAQSARVLVGSTLVAGYSATGRGVVASVAVSPATPALAAGQTQVLAATPQDARGNALAGRTVTWTSSDTNVAAVDSTGLVRTARVGTATITATSAGVAGTASVTVTPGAAAQLLRVSGDSQAGASGAAVAAPLVAGVLDRYGNPVAGATVTWEVVAGGGSITPASGVTDSLGRAAARWTLGYAEGAQSARALVGSTLVAGYSATGHGVVTSVAVSPGTATVVSGRTQPFIAAVKDAAGNTLAGRRPAWASSDTTRATVDATGLLTARAPGTVTVTASVEGVSGTATVTVSPVPIASVVVSPDTATVASGATRQYTATPEDSSGHTLAGRQVAWVSSDTTVATVDTAGVVRGARVGTAAITATAGGLSGTARVTVVPGAASRLLAVSGDSQAGASGVQLPAALVVRAVDRFGNPVPGLAVTWQAVSGGGTLSPASAATDSLGRASATWTLGTPEGAQSARAGVAGNLVADFTARARAVVASVTVSPPAATLVAGRTQQFAAAAKDAAGNTLAGRAPAWASSDTTRATVDATGLLTARAPGTVTVTASVEGVSGTATVTVSPVPIASVAVSPDTATVASGATRQYTATPKDSAGAALTGRQVTWTSSDTAIATVDSTGMVRGAKVGTAAITATAGGLSGTARVTVAPGAAAALAFTVQPAGGQAQRVLAPAVVVTVYDAHGNIVPTGSRAVTVALGANPGSASLGGTLSQTPAAGIATFGDLTVSVGGSGYTLVASSPGLTSATSAAFTEITVPIASVAVAPDTATVAAGATRQYTATPKDSAGGALAGRQVTWTSSDTAIATVDSTGMVRGAKIGTATIAATAGGLVGTGRVTVVPGAAAALAFTAQPLAARARRALTPAVAVTVYDAFGNVVTAGSRSVTVALGANPGGATLGGTVSQPSAAGIATFGDLTVSVGGTGYTLVASSPGLTSAASAIFDVASAIPMTVDIAGPDVIGLGLTNPLDVTLSQPAGPGGVTVTIASDNATLVTAAAPGTVVIAAGQTTGRIILNGLALGTTNVRATATGYADTLLAVQVSDHVVPAVASEIAVGSQSACALALGGAPYCWGSDVVGQLGATLPNGSTLPRRAAGVLTFASVTGGGSTVCGVTSTGAATCWGSNANGLLGTGSTAPASSETPLAVSGGLTFAQISAGATTACGLTLAGAAYCWGDNSVGLVGNGGGASVSAPTAVAGGHTFKEVSVGSTQACALTTGGEAYCWGSNLAGQLGDGTTTERDVPTPVAGGLKFESISPGLLHTCARTAAGAVYCWGLNAHGELGNGTTAASSVPVATQGGVTLASVTAAYFFTCGLTTSGAAQCWGQNPVADGTTVDRPTPTPVSGGLVFRSLSTGGGEACGVTTTGEIWCWGSGGSGQIGDGGTASRTAPVRVTPGGPPVRLAFVTQPTTTQAGQVMTPAVQVAVQDGFGAAAATPDTVVLWLYYVTSGPTNHYDQLPGGFASVVNGVATFPNLVMATGAGTGRSLVLRLASPGTAHDLSPCGVGLPPICGALFLAASAAFDVTVPLPQLTMDVPGPDVIGVGLTNPLDVTLPQPAGAGGVAVTVTSDNTGVVGVGAPGTVVIAAGQTTGRITLSGVSLGTTTVHTAAPGYASASLSVQVTNLIVPVAATELSVGSGHSCAVRAGGAAYCWGSNSRGQLGDPNGAPHVLPTRAAPGLTFVAISAGNDHTCGVTATGQGYCWGSDQFGQLGDGTTYSSTNYPVALPGGFTWAKLLAGDSWTCGLTTGGAVYCWGFDLYGQIGDSTTVAMHTAMAQVLGGHTFSDLVLFYQEHACALTPGGEAYCWGGNGTGAVGDGTNAPRPSPTAVSGGLRFASLASGWRHSCGLTAAGVAWCWGDDSYDQLGSGAPPNPSYTPRAVSGGITFASLTAGLAHTCGLTGTGTAYCWGDNGGGTQVGAGVGNLGDGTTTSRTTPVLVSGGLVFRTLSAGSSSTCGVTTADEIWCWGNNNLYQVGDGTLTNRLVPTRITPGGPPAAVTFLVQPSTTAAGATITPAVQVGVSDAFGAAAAASGPVSIAFAPSTDPNSGVSVLSGATSAPVVGGVATFSSLSIAPAGNGFQFAASVGAAQGTSHAFNITGSPGPIVVTVAGVNGVGVGLTNQITLQLPQPAGAGGLNLTVTSDAPGIASTPSSVFVPQGASASSSIITGVAAGSTTIRANAAGYTEGTAAVQVGDVLPVAPQPLALGTGFACYIGSGGALSCWGDNTAGQLGDGTTNPHLTPTATATGFSFVAISAGVNHACGLLADGTAYCWGDNSVGQLGTGGASSPTPAAVSGGLHFARIRAGGYFTCGLTRGGAVYCWGQDGGVGRIGNNSYSDQPLPVRAAGSGMYLDVSLYGNNHACALATTAAAYCWGYNSDGEIGNNNFYGSNVGYPTAVSGGLHFTSVASGTFHSCALQSSGQAWCWGDNNVWQLGFGTPPTDSKVPGAVLGGTSFASLYAGDAHSCGLTAVGTAYCWGINDLGNLGDGTTSWRLTPVPVTGGLTFSTLALGVNASCGLTPSNDLYCWGDNSSGQLGDGTTTVRLAPVKILP